MLILFQTSDVPGGQKMCERLQSLHIAHHIIDVETLAGTPSDQKEKHAPPVLVHGDQVIEGTGNIVQHLDALGRDVPLGKT